MTPRSWTADARQMREEADRLEKAAKQLRVAAGHLREGARGRRPKASVGTTR